MRLAYVSILSTVLAASPVYAQEAETEAATQDPAPADAAAAEADAVEEAFPIRRGMYAEADLGIFLTLFGRNTNKIGIPSKATSNMQPYLGVTFGYDLIQKPKMTLGLGVRLGAGYSSGAGRVSDAELSQFSEPELMTRPNDYAIYEAGLAAALSFLVHERIALTVKAGGGLGAAYANPYTFAGEAGSANAAIGAMFGGSLGVEYFTLLNDFSVGLDVRGAAAMISGNMIPNLAITVPIKYTF